jgi:N-acetylglucosaminyldiphosphoundecaprenol N-acetyl-beta-D-mannosaminyltransferase
MSNILGLNIHATSYPEVVKQSLNWAQRAESRSVVFATVHMVMEAFDRTEYRLCLDAMDVITPDGMPLVWTLRLMGNRRACRVYGPDCTLMMLQQAANEGIPVGFYGGTEVSLQKLITRLKERHPGLRVAFQWAPPFRDLSAEEDEEVTQMIRESGVRFLFVGLGCPKQEKWIYQHLGRVPAVMFGVGAAFDFLSKTKAQAPRWMMAIGCEWLFRLASEPRRLARRYVKNNPRFVYQVARQLMVSSERADTP